MEFVDEAFVLAARPYGETGAIVELLTRAHGLRAAYVPGGASRAMKPRLQPGALVRAEVRARTADQLGSARLEALGGGPSALFDDPLALAGLAAAAATTAGSLPEREPHPRVFAALTALLDALATIEAWPAVLVRFEAGLLGELGFGLDLSRCAATGATDDLRWVSPRTGRAVSGSAGAAYADRLLALPPFLRAAAAPIAPGDIGDGLALTGHFLETVVFAALQRPLPPARVWLVDRLRNSARL